jgi:hypothetical protein
MKKLMLGLLVVGSLLGSTGCGTPFIGIREVGDGSYMITRTRRGFIKMRGVVERCVPQGNTMLCTVIDDW